MHKPGLELALPGSRPSPVSSPSMRCSGGGAAPDLLPIRTTPTLLRRTEKAGLVWEDLLRELEALERGGADHGLSTDTNGGARTTLGTRHEPIVGNGESPRPVVAPMKRRREAVSTRLDVMAAVGAHAAYGSHAAYEFFNAFGRLDGCRGCDDGESTSRAAVPAPPAPRHPPLEPGDDAQALDAARRRLPTLWAELRRGIESGLCTGAQLSLSLRGEPAVHMWAGEVRPGVPMARDMLCNWMSTTKPVAVVAIAQLWERRLLDLSSPVARYLPEFGTHGKERILLEHLLTHTAGIPYADVSMWTRMGEWDEIVATICDSTIEPGWQPGRRAGYHTYSAWFVLGELVRRLDGRPFAQYAREEIFVPLGMADCHVGMEHATFEAYAAAGRLAELRTLSAAGVPAEGKAQGVAAHEVTPCVPGANGRGPAEQWLRLFQMLVDEGVGPDGTRLLQPATVRGLSQRYRVGMYDEVQGTPPGCTQWGSTQRG